MPQDQGGRACSLNHEKIVSLPIASRIGASNKTNNKGVAKLMFPASTTVLEPV
jgi:hypothetical protein